MNTTKKVLIIAAVCVLAGLLISLIGVSMLWNGEHRPGLKPSELKTVDISSPFDSIEIYGRMYDIELLPSADGVCRAVYNEIEDYPCQMDVEDGTLKIKFADERNLFAHFGVSFWAESVALKLYLPESEYEELSVKCSSGDISVNPGFAFSEAKLECSSGEIDFSSDVKNLLSAVSSSGDISVSNVSAQKLFAHASSGDIEVLSAEVSGGIELSTTSGKIDLDRSTGETVFAETTSGGISLMSTVSSGAFTLESTSGSISFSDVDGGPMSIKSTSGSIKGTVLSDKNFMAKSASGSIHVPDSVSSAARCYLSTTSGSITVKVAE